MLVYCSILVPYRIVMMWAGASKRSNQLRWGISVSGRNDLSPGAIFNYMKADRIWMLLELHAEIASDKRIIEKISQDYLHPSRFPSRRVRLEFIGMQKWTLYATWHITSRKESTFCWETSPYMNYKLGLIALKLKRQSVEWRLAGSPQRQLGMI